MQDKKYTADISGHFKKLATKLLPMLLWLIAITASIGAVAYLYSAYEEHKELTYMTSDKCSEHDYQTQICETEDGSLYLRRIEMANNRMSVSMLIDDAAWDDYKYSYWAFWFESCDTGIEVETDRLYSDGTPFVLRCTSRSEMYIKSSAPPRLGLAFTGEFQSGMKFNFGGFIIDHDYSQTDYSSLLRQHTLRNTAVERERKARKEKEAKEKQAKLEKEAKEKQAKLEKEAKERKARMEKEAKERQVKLAIAKSCSEKNKVKKEIFNVRLENAKKAMFKKGSVWHKCETSHQDYSHWCVRYELSIHNSTAFPIKKVKFGYEDFMTCSASPGYKRSIDALIPPKTIHKALFQNFTANKPFCTKLLDVEFDTTFKPEQC